MDKKTDVNVLERVYECLVLSKTAGTMKSDAVKG